jgi:hypothetical protein
MKKWGSVIAIVLGAGLLVFGLSGYSGGGEGILGWYGAGWDEDEQVLMAIGAMLIVGGLLVRR